MNPFFFAFGIPSGIDLVLLLAIVLVVFGAKRLPEIARSLGQSVNEFKKAKEEFDQAVASKPASTTPATVATPTAPVIAENSSTVPSTPVSPSTTSAEHS